MSELQDGIYFRQGERAGSSFCLVSLDINGHMDATSVGNELSQLWEVYMELKEYIAKYTSYLERVQEPKNPSILFAYGPKVFSLSGILKERPVDFNGKWGFDEAVTPDTPLFENSSLRYSKEICENSICPSYVMIQIISDSESVTKLGWTKTWEFLRKYRKNNDNVGLFIRRFYTGYNRPDNLSWLGFYDGISNMKSSERELVIAVKGNNLNDNDSWIRNGTYMTFMRFNIDVENWYDNEVEFQERIVGIDKETGCPIVGIQDGKNLIAPGCPVPNTDNVIQYGNEVYRDSFANSFSMYNRDSSIKHLDYSHVKQMIDGATQTDSNSEPSRIFRQGYEFLEPTSQSPYFRAGLNFVSFQSSPQKILNLLAYGFIKKDELAGKNEYSAATLGDFVSVDAAGIYLVPPSVDKNQFPGKVMFLP